MVAVWNFKVLLPTKERLFYSSLATFHDWTCSLTLNVSKKAVLVNCRIKSLVKQ